MWSLVSQMKSIPHWNLYILNHQQLYQIKWEEGELGTTSSETCTISSSSNYFWCGTLVCIKSNWLQIFERITSSEITSSTQLCFHRHSAKCMNSKPTEKFRLEHKYSQSKCSHFESCQFWSTSNFVSQREFVSTSCNHSAQVMRV